MLCPVHILSKSQDRWGQHVQNSGLQFELQLVNDYTLTQYIILLVEILKGVQKVAAAVAFNSYTSTLNVVEGVKSYL